MTAQEWKRNVASIGCILCQCLNPEISFGTHDGKARQPNLHHVREGQGMSQRASDFLVVPLCREHHQGMSGWHGLGKFRFYQRYKMDELDLLGSTLESMAARLFIIE